MIIIPAHVPFTERNAWFTLLAMHEEYVRLLRLNHTTTDDDVRADAANDGMRMRSLRDWFAGELADTWGREYVEGMMARLEAVTPTPTLPPAEDRG